MCFECEDLSVCRGSDMMLEPQGLLVGVSTLGKQHAANVLDCGWVYCMFGCWFSDKFSVCAAWCRIVHMFSCAL